MATYQWGFAARFRRNAYGWKSDLPIKRIKEAISEIKAVARKDTVLAAGGALLDHVCPALRHLLLDDAGMLLVDVVQDSFDRL
ncbi:MAG: hypothetical protein WCP99_21300, partial [Burkholderiales bacterium]